MRTKTRSHRLHLERLEDRTVLITSRLLANLASNSWFDPK